MIHIITDDITKRNVDCIVNAASNNLTPGSGVNGCIHRAAGPELVAESKALAPCFVGQAKITGGYNLPSEYVIHTVGPVYHRDRRIDCSIDLYLCYYRSLLLADEYECESIAFPAIAAGAYHFPMIEVAPVALKAAYDFIGTYPHGLKKIEFVLLREEDAEIWQRCHKDRYPEIVEEELMPTYPLGIEKNQEVYDDDKAKGETCKKSKLPPAPQGNPWLKPQGGEPTQGPGVAATAVRAGVKGTGPK